MATWSSDAHPMPSTIPSTTGSGRPSTGAMCYRARSNSGSGNSLSILRCNMTSPIEEMEVSPDHVHLFCSFPPRDSIAQVVTRFKSLSARVIFREFPRVKRRLWGGELWEDGYCARTVGDKVTAEVIRRSIQQHRLEKTGDPQLSLFE